MPEYPLARILILNANIIRARSIVNGSPTPAQCETINRDCKSLCIDNTLENKEININKTHASFSFGITVDENEPKPVFTPYTTIKQIIQRIV